MSTGLYDAHNHWATDALIQHRATIDKALIEIDLRIAVVNGTHPDDWPDVLELAQDDPRALPAIGLHPWQVNLAPDNWQALFQEAFQKGARTVGEIGLDQWIEDHDLERQQIAFRWQLNYAAQHNLPVSIHCLKAIGPLMETLRSAELPARGIHMHAYNGSVELIKELNEFGAYFSFNAGQLKPNAKAAPAAIAAVPFDRVLIETDAPDMLPISKFRYAELPGNTHEKPLNHPKNLLAAYQAIADIRKVSFQELSSQVAENFHNYFLK